MTGANEEDVALARRAAAGDRAAFAMLVEKHERALRSFLTKTFGAVVADDVAQEAFLRAWRAAGQYDGRARFSTWLTRIAWRCRLDILRREAREQEPMTDDTSLSAEKGAELRDMLSRLSEIERAGLILCGGHGWTHEEAAQMLQLPLGTLKSTVARAKSKCRDMWREERRS